MKTGKEVNQRESKNLEHRLNYITELKGFVCTCTRYFDNKEQLNEHIKHRTSNKTGGK